MNEYTKVLNELRMHYEKYTFVQLSEILNNVIYKTVNDKENNSYLEAPVKLLVFLSILIVSHSLNKYEENPVNSYFSGVDITEVEINSEKNYLMEKTKKIKAILNSKSFLNVDSKEKDFEKSFNYDLLLNYQNFNFPTIGIGDFIEFFENSQAYSKSSYRFKIHNNSLKLILELLASIMFKSGTSTTTQYYPYPSIDKDYYIFYDHLRFIQFIANDLNLKDFELKKILESLFLDYNTVSAKLNKETIYPNEIYKIFSGKIGLKFKDQVFFIPKTHFMLKSIVDYIITNSKKYGHNFENVVSKKFKDTLLSYYGNNEAYELFEHYEIPGNKGNKEQDVLITVNDSIFIIECKTQLFKPINKKFYVPKNNDIIGKGIEQAQRVENNIKNGSGEFISKEGKIFKVSHKSNIIKIVITFNDFNQMSMTPSNFFESHDEDDYNNLLVIDYFKLCVILWKCEKYGMDLLIKYVKQRRTEKSHMHSDDELDFFEYYLQQYEHNETFSFNTMDIIMSGISDNLYDEYDKYKNNYELGKLFWGKEDK